MSDEILSFEAVKSALVDAISCLSHVHFDMHRMKDNGPALAYKALLKAHLELEPPDIDKSKQPQRLI